jgi:RNA polymerase sigma-70 factor (ECF subfamily)
VTAPNPQPHPGTADRRSHFESLAAEVYEPLQRYLRRRATPEDAEELLDDVLLVMWRRLGEVPADAVLPWVYGVARRSLANRRRTNRRRLDLVERLKTTYERPLPIDPEAGEEHVELAEALTELREDDLELIRLWAWEQLEPREIALVLGTTANAVSLRLGRVKAKLEKKITRQRVASGGHKGDEHTGGHRS